MYSNKQQGKGLFAFFAGLVVALIAIAAMLVTLNRNSDKTFKQPELVKPQQPEILTPNNAPSVPQVAVDNTQPAPAKTVASAVQPPVATAPQIAPVTTQPAKTTNQAASELGDWAELIASEPAQKTTPVAPPAQATVKKPAAKVAEKEVKPTAQQILDSGNIEKAREVARKEAQAKAARLEKEQAAAKAKQAAASKEPVKEPAKETAKDKAVAAPEKTAKPAEPAKKATEVAKDSAKKDGAKPAGTVSIQAGAFANKKAAEDQRAKLALMGVQTQVVTVQSGGKTMYRVQTSKLQGDKAKQVQQTLQKNGVNSYTHK